MSKRVTPRRYCVRCGHEIGDRPFCVNPDCDQLPNFYRDVPGPRERGSPQRRRAMTSGAAGALPAEAELPDERVTELSDVARDPGVVSADRSTWALEPVAVLEAVGSPAREFALLPGTTMVGAQPPAKIVLDHPQVSSRHAKIDCVRSPERRWKVIVSDAGSTNGTFVNGQAIKSSELKDGDRVRFADVEFVVRFREQRAPRVTMEI